MTPFSYVQLPVAAMLSEPSQDAVVVSEGLFGEEVRILEQSNDWLLVTTPDGYKGWIRSSSLTTRSTPFTADVKIQRLRAHLYNAPDVKRGPALTLPFSASLQRVEALDERWIKVALPDGSIRYIQSGDISEESPPQTPSDLPDFSLRFLNLPYTWGGRSSFGYDCSGFVQMLYQTIGIPLPRDSHLQAGAPQLVQVLTPLSGDLLFFGSSEEQITHVGLYLADGKFIHATTAENQPWIRISSLNSSPWSESFQKACRHVESPK